MNVLTIDWGVSVRCAICNHNSSRVVDSRQSEDGLFIRRRRECEQCHHRFTTYERIDFVPKMVIKKDNSREPFDADKLRSGLIKACEKRSVSVVTLEKLADEIEQSVQNEMEREIPSTEIGELVMDKLKDVDEVSYVRFASVYRQFKDINTFMAELTKLLQEK